MRQGKIWGETEEIFRTETVSVNLLRIKAGGYCSEHRHSQKSNTFYVLAGTLEVSAWLGPPGDTPPDVTTVTPALATAIPAGVWHSFRAKTDCICLEIYQLHFTGDDIERRTRGGLTK